MVHPIPVQVYSVTDGFTSSMRVDGALGSVLGQCASLAGITWSIEAIGGQGYSFHKFMGCGLFFFSC